MTFKRKIQLRIIPILVLIWGLGTGSFLSDSFHPLIAMPIIMIFIFPFCLGFIGLFIWLYKEEKKYYDNSKCN